MCGNMQPIHVSGTYDICFITSLSTNLIFFSHSYELLRLQQKIDEGEIEIAGLDNMEADLHTKRAAIRSMQEKARSLMNLHRIGQGN